MCLGDAHLVDVDEYGHRLLQFVYAKDVHEFHLIVDVE